MAKQKKETSNAVAWLMLLAIFFAGVAAGSWRTSSAALSRAVEEGRAYHHPETGEIVYRAVKGAGE